MPTPTEMFHEADPEVINSIPEGATLAEALSAIVNASGEKVRMVSVPAYDRIEDK